MFQATGRCSPDIHVLPPSDLKDLLILIGDLMISIDKFVHRVSPLQASLTAREMFCLKYDAGKYLDEAKYLKQRCREVDAHYGWVLASDIVHVTQMFETDSEKGHDNAKYWMRSVFDRYEELKTKLGTLAAGSERRAIERQENHSP
tara:strand:- start:11685 stop:12122 length:438 start_codon:yes stop_codon:yes gene_type:complete